MVNTTEKERNTCSIKRGDVFLTRTSETQEELGMSCVALKDYPDATFNGFTKRLRPKNQQIVLPEFAGFYFRSPRFRAEVTSMASITTRASLNNGMLSDLSIILPPLEEQRTIASVLFNLNNKIAMLHRQNKTLEAMAETLFRQWFIEEENDDWEEGTLEQLVDTANTGLDAIRRAPIVEEETGIKCLRIQDISQSKPYKYWGNSKVTTSDYEKARLRKDDIIMARTCSPGIIYFVREDLNAVFNNGLARIRPNHERTYSIFLYYLFKTDEFIGHIYGISDGTSVQLNMKLGDLLSYKIKFPSKKIQKEYFPIFQSIDYKIRYNKLQINTLENLMDTLLPKLMSGEVRVEV